MIDPQRLRDDLPAVAAALRRRGLEIDRERLQTLDADSRRQRREAEELRAQRNEKSRTVGDLKRAGKDAAAVTAEVDAINEQLREAEAQLKTTQAALDAELLELPNLPHPSIPDGCGDADNAELRRWSEPPVFDFPPQDHTALGERLRMLDFALAAKLTAARFITMTGGLARLHRALAQFMLDLHINEHGYQEIYMPFMANPETLTGTGQLPKFEEDLFYAERDNLYLIPTAEVVVTNIVRDTLVEESALPMKFVCHTPCFRREAGSYGRDTRGMLRQHQFEKVELVHITNADESYAALEALTTSAEAVLQRLELPYRVIVLCGGDIGFAAAKTYDIEVWLPGQNTYREISSCSNCEDFQARRMKARYRNHDGKRLYVHTLNGSGIAVGRTLIAVMENYQQADGSIIIPAALRPYMGGATQITASGDD